MTQNFSEIEEHIYSTFASVASSIGYSEVHGRIIAALLVADKPLSLQEISKKTNYSLAAISLSLDLLELVGLVKKIKLPKEKKLYARLDGDLLEGLKNAMLLKIQKEIFATQREFKKYKASKEAASAVAKLEKEIDRLEKYINKMAKIPLPKRE